MNADLALHFQITLLIVRNENYASTCCDMHQFLKYGLLLFFVVVAISKM